MGKDKKDGQGFSTVDPRWVDVVMLCRKCMGKLDGGAADDLRSDFKKALKRSGRRKDVRIVETGCLDVCPKGGVTVCRASRLGGAAKVGVVSAPFDGEALARVLGYED